MSDTQEPSTQSESRPPAQPAVGSFETFLLELTKHLGREQILSNLRVLTKGLFVSEPFAQTLVAKYQEWHKTVTGSFSQQSDERARKHLFGQEDPKVYYLIEGKQCLTGFLAALPFAQPDRLPIPHYPGSLIDAATQLHPKDPFLQSAAGIKAVTDLAKGLQFSLQVKRWEYRISPELLQRFSEMVIQSRRLNREFDQVQRGLRYALPALSTVLSRARLLRGKKKTLIPSKFRRDPKLKLVRFKRLYFVLLDENRIDHIYELRARNLVIFLRQELDLLKRDKHSQRIGGLSLAIKPGPSAGFISIKGHKLRISRRVFSRFLEGLLRLRESPAELPSHYTLRDAIKLLAQLLQQGTWIPKREIPQRIFEKLAGHETLIQSGQWYFIISGEIIESALLA
ncbi:MAG: hypothetical protein K1X83_03930 [Oligoflexia bacterium]|nr:hypothetical protein [Oligoflexia bacterium]